MSVFESIQTPKKKGKDSEPWLTVYADLVTNLLAFFVLLLSTANFDAVKMNAVTKEVTRVKNDTLDLLEIKVKKEVKKKKLEDKVDVNLKDFGLVIQFRSEQMFFPGSDRLTKVALQDFAPVLDILASIEKKYSFSLEGHTDDVPLIGSKTFKDNWSLSSSRGAAFLKELYGRGVPVVRMNIAGFADTRPVQDPKPLVELLRSNGTKTKSSDEPPAVKLRKARQLNRRVVVRVYQ